MTIQCQQKGAHKRTSGAERTSLHLLAKVHLDGSGRIAHRASRAKGGCPVARIYPNVTQSRAGGNTIGPNAKDGCDCGCCFWDPYCEVSDQTLRCFNSDGACSRETLLCVQGALLTFSGTIDFIWTKMDMDMNSSVPSYPTLTACTDGFHSTIWINLMISWRITSIFTIDDFHVRTHEHHLFCKANIHALIHVLSKRCSTICNCPSGTHNLVRPYLAQQARND